MSPNILSQDRLISIPPAVFIVSVSCIHSRWRETGQFHKTSQRHSEMGRAGWLLEVSSGPVKDRAFVTKSLFSYFRCLSVRRQRQRLILSLVRPLGGEVHFLFARKFSACVGVCVSKGRYPGDWTHNVDFRFESSIFCTRSAVTATCPPFRGVRPREPYIFPPPFSFSLLNSVYSACFFTSSLYHSSALISNPSSANTLTVS